MMRLLFYQSAWRGGRDKPLTLRYRPSNQGQSRAPGKEARKAKQQGVHTDQPQGDVCLRVWAGLVACRERRVGESRGV